MTAPQDAPAGAVLGGSWPFGTTAEEDAEHRRGLRNAARLASRRERNYDQPWWAANVSTLLEYIEMLETALSSAREEGAAAERERIVAWLHEEITSFPADYPVERGVKGTLALIGDRLLRSPS